MFHLIIDNKINFNIFEFTSTLWFRDRMHIAYSKRLFLHEYSDRYGQKCIQWWVKNSLLISCEFVTTRPCLSHMTLFWSYNPFWIIFNIKEVNAITSFYTVLFIIINWSHLICARISKWKIHLRFIE